MKFEQIITDIKNKVYYPIYFLMGEEPFFIDEITKCISENVLTETEKEFNQTVLYGKDTEVAVILNQAKRYPMMSNYNVVIVKEAQNIKQIENLQSYIEKPLKSTVLVICYRYKSLDKRKKFAKLIEEKGVLFESKKLYENKIPDWITSFIKEKGYKISPKATMLLSTYLGTDLGKIVNELNKLMIVVSKDVEITPNHIEENVGISKDYNNFELNIALGKKDILKANQIVEYFKSNPKDNPLLVTIITLFGYFVKVMAYHNIKDKSNNNNVAAVLGVHPFFINDYKVAAKNYTVNKLTKIFSLLREYDAKSKGIDNISAEDSDLLKELVYKILH